MAEGETPSYYNHMGSKYKEDLELKWKGNPISAMRIRMIQNQADENLSNICKGKLKVRQRRSRKYGENN
jgi:hypothetical protein